MFSKPREGIHSFRVFDFAVFDIVATVLFAFILSKKTEYPLWQTLIACFVLAIIVHKLFNVETKLNSMLF